MDDVLVGADGAPTPNLTPDQAERLVLDLVTRHAESLLRVARRYSYCADDAQDAYQRAMEILLRHAHRLDPARAGGWLHTVVKHEALAVRAQRQRLVGPEDVDLDRLENRTAPSPEEQVIGLDQVARAAEALRGVKANEAKAMWLKAAGHSYAEISERESWTYTKVNRCLAEGRRSFLERYAGIESGAECRRWAPLLSAIVDREADAQDVVQARVHLRNCPSCRATVRQLRLANGSLAVLLPAVGMPAIGDTTVAEVASGGVARAWEWLVSLVHDRAAGGAVRLHAALDAATNHKMAAIAASAAALAGGGIAVERATHAPLPLPTSSAIAHPAPRTPSPLDATRAEPAAVRRPGPPLRTEPTIPPVAPSAEREKPTGRKPATPRRRRSDPPSEPLIDPVESRRPAPAPATPTSRPAPAPTPAPKPSPPTTKPDANAEFGFES